MNDDKNVQGTFDKVKFDFVNKLHLTIELIDDYCKELSLSPKNLEVRNNLSIELHRLISASSTFGLPSLSNLAYKLDKNIDYMLNNKDIKLNTENLKTIYNLIEDLKSNHFEITKKFTIEQQESKDNGPLIYVVDEDEEYAKHLSKQIKKFGYKRKVLNNILDLEQEIQQNNKKAGLIIINMNFKNSDYTAVEIIEQIKSKGLLDIPVLFMSSEDTFENRLSVIRVEGQGFIPKPIENIILKDRLEIFAPKVQAEPFSVLIVDNDENLINYCVSILEQVGVRTVSIMDPSKIFQSIIDLSPDLILIDMHMTTCTGIELSMLIRQHQAFCSIPIIVMSKDADIKTQYLVREAGADDFLLKPFKPSYLIKVLLNRAKRARYNNKLVYRDGLTGLEIFSKIKEHAKVLMESCKRYNQYFSFVILDLDYFKQINDTYGHLSGDAVLRSISDYLKLTVRAGDIVGRYGGEEFVIIFPYINLESAVLVMDKLRIGFSNITHYLNGSSFNVTFSAGVSCSSNKNDIESIILAADKALYIAKENGRNKVVADPENLSFQATGKVTPF